jgi:hypothetical protein
MHHDRLAPLLGGERSPPAERRVLEKLAQALPDDRVHPCVLSRIAPSLGGRLDQRSEEDGSGSERHHHRMPAAMNRSRISKWHGVAK